MREILIIWDGLAMKIIAVPVIIGALGCCTKNLEDIGFWFRNRTVTKGLPSWNRKYTSESVEYTRADLNITFLLETSISGCAK